jgi:hypothetical protein
VIEAVTKILGYIKTVRSLSPVQSRYLLVTDQWELY